MKFSILAEVFEKMEKTSARLELTSDLAKLFSKASLGEIRTIVYLLQGIVLPSHKGVDLGMGEKLAIQSVSIVSGKNPRDVEQAYKKLGDLGDAAAELVSKKKQTFLHSEELTVQRVYSNFYKIATASGDGSQDVKIKLLAELLSNANPSEAKAIVRFVIGSLRLGVAEATIIDALSYAATKSDSKELRPIIERAFNLRSDLGEVAEFLLQNGVEKLKKFSPKPFEPIRPALAERLSSAEEIFAKLGECSAEGKYDGMRIAGHMENGKVMLFSRRQENVTRMFPEIVEELQKLKAKSLILEGEAVAFNDEKDSFLPFQFLMQRRRKHGIAAKAREIPLRFHVFELLYVNGEDLTEKPYSERIGLMKKILSNFHSHIVLPAKHVIVGSAQELEEFFNECIAKGLEGIIAKDLNAPYVAGARKFAWIKLKKSYSQIADTVDLVIIGYYLGKGKRHEFQFGGILCASYDPKHNTFNSFTRVGTGFTEDQMTQLQKMLEKLQVKERPSTVSEVDKALTPDFWVKPRVVVEILGDEITKSELHKTAFDGEKGLALRFPRLVKVRDDKKAEDATTEEEILELFEMQGRKR